MATTSHDLSYLAGDRVPSKLNRRVLLFTGGIDSTCYAWLCRPDVLLYVPTSAPYMRKELAAAVQVHKILGRAAPMMQASLTIAPPLFDLSYITRSDGAVPMRNLFLLAAASLYGDKIIIGRVADDVHADGSTNFRDAANSTLNVCWSEQPWCEGRAIKINAPFEMWTKAALIAHYLKNGGPRKALEVGVSCYAETPEPCGQCRACVRKREALAAAECEG